ncbi:MAG TPA: hypothetical protein VLZ75_09195 [Chitinophagales bacterium]|nr:hypothetical protein [Chitinophagales bacterium]
MIKFSKTFYKDILAILCIVVTGVLVLKGFSERVDINLTDDSGYLVLGLRIAEGALAGFGPLYSVMFKVLKQFTDDTIQIYDTAMYLMYILPPVAAYLFLRTLGLSVVVTLLISVGFMVSPNIMSFITWSKISHYTIILIMIWAILTTKLRSTLSILFSLLIFTFFLGYIRPESHLSFYISAIIFFGFWAWKERFRFQIKWLLFLIPLLVVMVFFFFFIGNPMGGGRSNIAFAQQFSYNYCEWNGLNHFDWIQWRDISHKNFGDFNTLGEAFKNNPTLFVKHVLYNFQQYILKFIAAVQSIFFPPAIFKWSTYISSVLVILILLAKILYVGFSNWWTQVKALFLKYLWTALGLVVIGIPSVVASMVFYTREHYLLLVMPIVLFVIALILIPSKSEKDTAPRILHSVSFAGAILLILFLRPSLSDYRTFDVWEEYTYPSNRKTIEAVRAMNITQEVRQVDYEGGFSIYMPKNFKWANPFNKETEPYSEFEEKYQPNFYYVTKALLSNKFLTEDAEFMDIIERPEAHGFKVIKLQAQNKGYLLVQDSIVIATNLPANSN